MTFVCTAMFGLGALMVYAAWFDRDLSQALSDIRGKPWQQGTGKPEDVSQQQTADPNTINTVKGIHGATSG